MKKSAVGISAILLLFAIPQAAQGWIQYLDGSALPDVPWISYQDGPPEGRGETVIVDFGGTNQVLRVNSGDGSNEWYVGPLGAAEVVAGARFSLAVFSSTGRENLLCVQVGGTGKHSPSVSISLVDGRYKIWAYTDGVFGDPNGGSEIKDIGPVSGNEFHTAYIYAHEDGMVKVWWDGNLIYDDVSISLGGYDGYVEWGSGSWQFDASSTVDYDWVGWGEAADLPQSFTSVPAHGSVQQDTATEFAFAVVTKEGAGVGTNGIAITVNGVDRTPELVISGTGTNRQGTLPGLVANRVYQTRLRVTDLIGTNFNYTVDFDTFSRSHFTFEAEDFNFDGGQYLDAIVLSSIPAGDNYLERVGVEDIDHKEFDTDPAASPHAYRSGSLVGTEATGDTLRPKYVDAQASDPGVADYNVTGVQAGEWLNYTRTYPTGTFNIYGRFAFEEDGAPFEAAMGKVSGATTMNQTVTPLGTFRGVGHHAQTYSYVPLTDAQANLVVVSLGGIETLRLTSTLGAVNVNYFMLVPAAATSPTLNIARSGGDIVISWVGSGFNLEFTDQLGTSWTAVTNQANPFITTPTGTARFYRLRQ